VHLDRSRADLYERRALVPAASQRPIFAAGKGIYRNQCSYVPGYDRCTPDSCRLVAPLKSAGSGRCCRKSPRHPADTQQLRVRRSFESILLRDPPKSFSTASTTTGHSLGQSGDRT
jgi:hypothetical protein